MRVQTVDYRRRDGAAPGEVFNRGFWVRGLPRVILLCRVFRHWPVVDGIPEERRRDHVSPAVLWVACGQCGMRGEPSGRLDPARFKLGDRYRGPWAPPGSLVEKIRPRGQASRVEFYPPGRIAEQHKPVVGGQLVIGRKGRSAVGWEVKIGNAGSEHVLAARFEAGWLGVLYLHTEEFGRFLQRRLNPVGYESRVTGFDVSARAISWKVWARRDAHCREDGERWWRNGEIRVQLVDRLLGPGRYEYVDMPDGDVTRLVRMPERDYLVKLQLQRCTYGRRRGRKPKVSWLARWSALGRGIPTGSHKHGSIEGSGVKVSDRAVHAGMWAAEAVAKIVEEMTEWRNRNGWDPIGATPVAAAKAPA